MFHALLFQIFFLFFVNFLSLSHAIFSAISANQRNCQTHTSDFNDLTVCFACVLVGIDALVCVKMDVNVRCAIAKSSFRLCECWLSNCFKRLTISTEKKPLNRNIFYRTPNLLNLHYHLFEFAAQKIPLCTSWFISSSIFLHSAIECNAKVATQFL